MELEYQEVRKDAQTSVTTIDDTSAKILKGVLLNPYPYTSSTNSPLTQLPYGMDSAKSMRQTPVHFTTWNTQSRLLPTSFGARSLGESEIRVQASRERVPTTIVLQGDALKHALAQRQDIPENTLYQINHGTRWITRDGNIIKKLPTKYKFRTEKYTTRVPNPTARSISAPPDVGLDESFESLSSEDTNDAPVTGVVQVLPVRCVGVHGIMFQQGTPTSVPKSQAMQWMEAYASEKAQTSNPLVPGVRSAVTRDLPAITALVSYMDGKNCSFMDTATALRAMLYAYPAHKDAWTVDKLDQHFVRSPEVGKRSNLRIAIKPLDDVKRDKIKIVAVSMPTFASHVLGKDALLNSTTHGAGGIFNSEDIDTTWVAIPITSNTLAQPWALEYIVAFLSSTLWAGRLSYMWTNEYVHVNKTKFKAYYSAIPAAHNVYIPGPTNAMLVLTEDTTQYSSGTISIHGHSNPILVYPGVRAGSTAIPDLTPYVTDISTAWYDHTFTTGNFVVSARRMLSALQTIEDTVCVNMSYALAATMASELTNVMPETPYVSMEKQSRHYAKPYQGAWTFGATQLLKVKPFLQTSDIETGTVTTHPQIWSDLLMGYSFAMLSPLLQYAHSSVKVGSVDNVEGGSYNGKQTYWESVKPDTILPQYRVHTCHSVYRLLSALGYIPRNNYVYHFSSVGGLQNTLVTNGVLISLTLALALTRNDISLRMWAGLEKSRTQGSSISMESLWNDWGLGYLNPHATGDIMENTTVREGTNALSCIDKYYGISPDDDDWGTHIPLPCYAMYQWANKLKLNMAALLRVSWGNVTPDVDIRHAICDTSNRVLLPLLHTTLNISFQPPISVSHRYSEGQKWFNQHVWYRSLGSNGALLFMSSKNH